MPLAFVASGSQVAQIGTNHSLTVLNSANTYVYLVDMGSMANADIVELRIHTTVLATETGRLAYYAVYANSQGTPNKYSVPVPSMVTFQAFLRQAAGTARTFPWAVVSLD